MTDDTHLNSDDLEKILADPDDAKAFIQNIDQTIANQINAIKRKIPAPDELPIHRIPESTIVFDPSELILPPRIVTQKQPNDLKKAPLKSTTSQKKPFFFLPRFQFRFPQFKLSSFFQTSNQQPSPTKTIRKIKSTSPDPIKSTKPSIKQTVTTPLKNKNVSSKVKDRKSVV